MARSKELWRTLQVGDRVRILEMPPELSTPHACTRRAYERLIARGRSLRVSKIDDWGLPWVRFKFRQADGRWEYHSLAINHGGIVKVKPRRDRESRS